jgi:hypothetical protein
MARSMMINVAMVEDEALRHLEICWLKVKAVCIRHALAGLDNDIAEYQRLEETLPRARATALANRADGRDALARVMDEMAALKGNSEGKNGRA